MKKHLTVSEAAVILGIHPASVRERLRTGSLKGEQIHPRLWLIPAAEVERARLAGPLKVGRKPGVKARKERSNDGG